MVGRMRLEIQEPQWEAGKIMPILHIRNLRFREGKRLAKSSSKPGSQFRIQSRFKLYRTSLSIYIYTNLWGGFYYFSFDWQRNETQRGWVTCPRSHSSEAAEPRSFPSSWFLPSDSSTAFGLTQSPSLDLRKAVSQTLTLSRVLSKFLKIPWNPLGPGFPQLQIKRKQNQPVCKVAVRKRW